MATPQQIREWGIANGLAKPGRGRISTECREAYYAAVGGMPIPSTTGSEAYEDVPLPFEDTKPEVEYLPPPPRKVLRKENMAYSITSGGAMVGHLDCGTCRNLIQYCACPDGPDALGWVRREAEQKPYLVEA